MPGGQGLPRPPSDGPRLPGSGDASAVVPAVVAEDPADRAVRDLALVDADPEVRIDAASGRWGPLGADQFAVAMLDESVTVRREAVEGLAVRGTAVPLPLSLLEAALADENASVREALVELLVRLDDPRAEPLLERSLADPVALVREEALEGLYRWRKRRGIGSD
jgi:HEAT repeat protein